MSNQKAMIGSFERCPAAHASNRSRPQQVYRCAGTKIVTAAVRWKMPLVRPPAELGRLGAFTDEPVDRPGVDEFVRLLGPIRDLRIALGDMDHLDAERLGKAGPIGAVCRNLVLQAVVPRQIDQSLFDKMRHETGIGAVRQDRGRAAGITGTKSQCALAQRVVRACRRRQAGIGVATRPGLDASVEVKRTSFLT